MLIPLREPPKISATVAICLNGSLARCLQFANLRRLGYALLIQYECSQFQKQRHKIGWAIHYVFPDTHKQLKLKQKLIGLRIQILYLARQCRRYRRHCHCGRIQIAQRLGKPAKRRKPATGMAKSMTT